MEQKLTHNWLLWLPILVSFGILGYFGLRTEPKFHAGICVLIAIIVCMIFNKNRVLAIYIMAIALGFYASMLRTQMVAAPILSNKIEGAWIKAKVEEIQHGSNSARLTVSNLWVNGVFYKDTPIKAKVTVRSNIENLMVGDVIIFKGVLMSPPAPAMPGGFDYRRFAYYQQIGAIGYAISKVKIKNSSPISANFIEVIRQKAIARIGQLLPQPTASIASGMLVGDTSYLKQKVYDQVRIAGIAHVIAISGMHMVVVVSIIFLVSRWLCGLSQYLTLHFNIKKIAALLSIVGSLFYLCLAGSPVSAQRAYIMSAMVLLAIIVDRHNYPLHSLAIACTVLLLATPEAVLNPSLQMSVAACFGLICSYKAVQVLLPTKAKQGWGQTIFYYGVNIASSTLVAGIFTAPFIMYHFHQFSTYSVVANLISIPLTDFILMPLGMVGLLLMPFGLDKWVFVLMHYGIECMLWVAKSVASLPASSLFVPAIPDYTMLFFAYGVIFAFIGKRYIGIVGLSMVIISAVSLLWVRMPDLMVDSQGKLFAVRYHNRYYFSEKRSNRFTRTVWQESLGEKDAVTIKAANIPNCDLETCVVEAKHKAIVTKNIDEELCGKYDVIVNLGRGDMVCDQPYIISVKDLSKSGTHMIWLNKDKVVIEKAISPEIMRPWS